MKKNNKAINVGETIILIGICLMCFSFIAGCNSEYLIFGINKTFINQQCKSFGYNNMTDWAYHEGKLYIECDDIPITNVFYKSELECVSFDKWNNCIMTDYVPKIMNKNIIYSYK